MYGRTRVPGRARGRFRPGTRASARALRCPRVYQPARDRIRSTAQNAFDASRQPERGDGRRAGESLRSRSCCALYSAWRTRPPPGTRVRPRRGRSHASGPLHRVSRRRSRGASGSRVGGRLAAACARPRHRVAGNRGSRFSRADFRPRVSEAASQRRRFVPRAGCRDESRPSRRVSDRVRAIAGFPAAAPAAARRPPSREPVQVVANPSPTRRWS